MKIFIIGTTSYLPKMIKHKEILELDGCDEVRIPKFDDFDLDELEICQRNIDEIRWADEVHIFWDQRSMGTIFDFGATVALRKPIKIIFMNPKTFANVMRWYADPKDYEYETSERHFVKGGRDLNSNHNYPYLIDEEGMEKLSF